MHIAAVHEVPTRGIDDRYPGGIPFLNIIGAFAEDGTLYCHSEYFYGLNFVDTGEERHLLKHVRLGKHNIVRSQQHGAPEINHTLNGRMGR